MAHLVRLHGRVDAVMYSKFKKRFQEIPSGHTVFLHISSSGGELRYGRKIQRLIMARMKDIQVVGIGYQRVHSAALHFFVACTYRVGYTNTKYLLHLPKSDGSLEGDQNLAKTFDEERKYLSEMLSQPESQIQMLMEAEDYIGNEQALPLNILNFDLKKNPKFI